MAFRLNILPRAERDAQHIFDYLAEQSPEGAAAWWRALEAAIQSVVGAPEQFARAPESPRMGHEIRQFLFKTPRGRRYRGIFVVVGEEIRVLRIRGPGQAPLEDDEIV